MRDRDTLLNLGVVFPYKYSTSKISSKHIFSAEVEISSQTTSNLPTQGITIKGGPQ